MNAAQPVLWENKLQGFLLNSARPPNGASTFTIAVPNEADPFETPDFMLKVPVVNFDVQYIHMTTRLSEHPHWDDYQIQFHLRATLMNEVSPDQGFTIDTLDGLHLEIGTQKDIARNDTVYAAKLAGLHLRSLDDFETVFDLDNFEPV